MWYNAGTITVAAGSVDVVGNATAFVGNVDTSHALIAPDGRIYEIAQVVSATALKLVRPYAGGGAANVAYDILPTQVNLAGMAIRLDELLATFRVVRDTVGQGMFPDGTLAAPGIRFSTDQDTGWRRTAENSVAIVTGGVDRLAIGPDGTVELTQRSASTPTAILSRDPSGDLFNLRVVNGVAGGPRGTSKSVIGLYYGGGTQACAIDFMRGGGAEDGIIGLRTGGVERARFDGDGNFLLGIAAGSAHTIRKGSSGSEGALILSIGYAPGETAGFFAQAGTAPSSASANLKLNAASSTGRSLNTGGTINTGGADYAEYMVKAAGCGTIDKGDVCGVDRDGRLSKTWADSVSFVIKSTDPSLVGGDTWDAEVGPKPEQPGAEPAEPTPPAPPAEDADDTTIAAWHDTIAAYPAQVASYQAARAEWQLQTDAYGKALPVWEAAHEKARQCVDRIAFCGQAPVNVDDETLAACEAALADGVAIYLVAVARGAGIGVLAVREQDMTLPQYMRRVGKVWAIRDGRPWVDVQHG